MLDESEFLSWIMACASLSKYHEDHPYCLDLGGEEHIVTYQPAELRRGHLRRQLQLARPDLVPRQLPDHRVAAQVQPLLWRQLADRVPHRLSVGALPGSRWPTSWPTGLHAHLLPRSQKGSGPVYGGDSVFQDDPKWRDYILFYEYFHGDTGQGLGAGHETGWTGLVAMLLQEHSELLHEDIDPFAAERDENQVKG